MARKAASPKPLDYSPALLVPARLPLQHLVVAGVLLALGIVLWVWPMEASFGGAQHLILAIIALTIAAIPATRNAAARLLDKIRQPSPGNTWRTAGVIALLSGVYLFATAWWQSTDFVPKVADESSYLLQIRMLAHGRLWTDPHPPEIRPLFDSINILVEPTYGSMYFPGTALLYVPGAWLHLPYYFMPLLISAACVGLFYRLVVELIDGAYAASAVVMLLGLTKFRGLALMLFSQTPMLFFSLLMMLAYLRWRRDRKLRYAAIIGGLAGWAGITRPADALCYAVPIGVAMLLDLFKKPSAESGPTPPSRFAKVGGTLGVLILAATPFLSLQLIQNVGMTGHWWEFPEARYADATYPAPMLGFHKVDPAMFHRPMLPEKQFFNEQMAEGIYATHMPSLLPAVWWRVRLPQTFLYSLPNPLFVLLLPLGFLGLTSRPRRVLVAVPVCFVAFYLFYVFYIQHYMVVIAPAMIVLALLGFRAAGEILARLLPRSARAVSVAAILLPAAIALGSFPELDRDVHDEDLFGPDFPHDEPMRVETRMSQLSAELGPTGKAIVFFRYAPPPIGNGEPVYNLDVVWPDDAKIIRVQDRGPANAILLRYYFETRHEPDRVVYLYDRSNGELKPLGTVESLARQGEAIR